MSQRDGLGARGLRPGHQPRGRTSDRGRVAEGLLRLTGVPNTQLSKPPKVSIPERYIESESEEPLSPEELEERWQRTERIKNLLARSR